MKTFIVVFHFDGDSPAIIRVNADSHKKAEQKARGYAKSLDDAELYIDSVSLVDDIKLINPQTVFLYQLGAPDNPPSDVSEPFPWDDIQTDWCTSMVVAATSPEEARATAAKNSGDEGRDVWLNERHTTCVKIGTADAGVAVGYVVLKNLI